MSTATVTDLTLREPGAPEVRRVLYLFQHVPPPGAWLLAGVRALLIPRFVAARAAWMKGDRGQFRLACQPGMARRAVAGLFIIPLGETQP